MHASSVEPVVRTSSMSRMCLFISVFLFSILNMPLVFVNRSKIDLRVCVAFSFVLIRLVMSMGKFVISDTPCAIRSL